MYKLLGRKTSGNVQKVVFMLEELGVPYERLDYGRQFENTTTPEYKALNPTSKVPTLVDGGKAIWESNTILRYLAAKERPALTGSTPAEWTDVDRWMDFQLAAVNPGYLAAFKGAKLTPEEQTPEYKEQAKDLAAQMAIVDGHLANKNYLALGKLTIADIAYGPIMKRCLDFKIQRNAMPNLERWMAAIATLPSFKAATA
ncbi:MAG TPA: glutathione S-transferase family protein [Aestuariivirga sp.]|nr:glutathione S-transferase family protein [Aestuariivirga sp.]